MNKKISYFSLVITLLSLFISSCGSIGGEVEYQAPGIPLSITVNTWGEVNFNLASNVEIPTPLGTFTAGLVADPSKRFKAENTLTVRVNGEDHIYDLHGQDFSIDFEDGYYEKIRLEKRGNNIFLELRNTQQLSGNQTSSSSAQSNTSSTKYNNNCDDVYSPRLATGEKAQVIVFQVRVRTRPSKSASTENYLAENRTVSVLEGPVCADDWWWWEIYSNELGFGGWVAEGDEENYYFRPR